MKHTEQKCTEQKHTEQKCTEQKHTEQKCTELKHTEQKRTEQESIGESTGLKRAESKRLVLGGLLMIFAYGLSNNIVAYYITPVTESLGYTRAAFNFCFTLMSVVSFLTAPLYGWLFIKIPVRRIILLGGIIGAACFVGYSFCSSIAAFYAVGIIQGAVQNGSTNMAAVVLINRFFDEKHSGSAMGLVMSGTGICSMMMSAVLPMLIERHGWRNGYLLCGFLWAAVMFAAFFLIKENPSSVGEKRQSEKEKQQEKSAVSGLTCRQALHCGGFYLLLVCVLICNIIMVCSQHLPAYFQDVGLSGVQSGRVMMVFSLGLIVWKILLGQCYDRLGAIPTVILSYVSFMLGMWTLSLGAKWALIAGSLLAALGIASSTVLFPLITRKVFGSREYAPIWGNISMAVAFGVAVGSPIWGLFYDHFGSYRPAFWGAPVLLGVNLGLLVMLMKKEYYTDAG